MARRTDAPGAAYQAADRALRQRRREAVARRAAARAAARYDASAWLAEILSTQALAAARLAARGR